MDLEVDTHGAVTALKYAGFDDAQAKGRAGVAGHPLIDASSSQPALL